LHEQTLRFPPGHVLYLAPAISQWQRSPGILLHERWTQGPYAFSGEARIGSLDLPEVRLHGLPSRFISAHLPHSEFEDVHYFHCLDNIQSYMSRHKTCLLGVDANAVVGPYDVDRGDDPLINGTFGIGHRSERGTLFLEWCRQRRQAICNTLAASAPHGSDAATHRMWTSAARRQIDFITIPCHSMHICTSMKVLDFLQFTSDHYPVRAVLLATPPAGALPPDRSVRTRKRKRKPINWTCHEPALFEEATEAACYSETLEDYTALVSEAAAQHGGPAPGPPSPLVGR